VHFARLGIIDFSRDDLNPVDLKTLVDEGSPYLELTPEGCEYFGSQLEPQPKPTSRCRKADHPPKV